MESRCWSWSGIAWRRVSEWRLCRLEVGWYVTIMDGCDGEIE